MNYAMTDNIDKQK